MTVPPGFVGLLLAFGVSLQTAAGAPPASQPERAAQFVRVYASDTPRLVLPKAIRQPNVRYTPEALHAGVQGVITLEVTVGPDGHVRDAMIRQGLAAAPDMDDRAVAALSEWLFEPGTLDGRPVAVRTAVTFTLQLR